MLQRRRAIATPSRNAIDRLVKGAQRVAARSLASGSPGCCERSITMRRRSTATLRLSVTSSIVRETSVALSMVRSAMLGDGTVGGMSMLMGRMFNVALRDRQPRNRAPLRRASYGPMKNAGR